MKTSLLFILLIIGLVLALKSSHSQEKSNNLNAYSNANYSNENHFSSQSRPNSNYTGKIVYCHLILDWTYGAPDGFPRRVIGINGQFPGPTIEATAGDTIMIDVTNKLDRSMSIHWHGMFQIGTAEMDGSAFVTECPTPPGHTKTYTFHLNQHGTYWYHSHFMNEIIDGCKGALIIHRAPDDPEPYHYEKDVIVELTDWYHTEADVIWRNFMNPPSPTDPDPPNPVSVLINGIGQVNKCYTGDIECHYNVIEASPHGHTRVRVIAASAYRPIIVSIDEHALIITEVDGVPVMWRDTFPEDVNSGHYRGSFITHIRINVGQRYSFIAVPLKGVKPRAGDKFWLRAVVDIGQFEDNTDSAGTSPTHGYGGRSRLFSRPEIAKLAHTHTGHNGKHTHLPSYYEVQDEHYRTHTKRYVEQMGAPVANSTTSEEDEGVTLALAIYSYGKSKGFPEDASFDYASTLSSLPCPECLPCNDLHPIHDLSPPKPDRTIHLNLDLYVDYQQSGFQAEVGHWNNRSCFPQAWGTTTLDLIQSETPLPSSCLTYEINQNEVILVIIDNHDNDGEHPIHLHGHVFWVLAQGNLDAGNFNARNTSLNWHNPLMRDTVTVNPNSHVVLLFIADNWGPWMMHCHINWHMMTGLSMLFNESPYLTQKVLGKTKYPEPCLVVSPPFTDDAIHTRSHTYASGPYLRPLWNHYQSVVPDY